MEPTVPFVRRIGHGPHPELLDALRRHLPEVDVVEHAELTDEQRATVTVAIVDGPSADQLETLPNLALIQSTWAGVEEIIPVVPDGVAIARMVDPQLAATMAEAVLAWTLFLHREMPRYARQQRERVWKERALVKAQHRRIGIVGLGALGRAAAHTLVHHGFPVTGWSRSPKAVVGVECVHGADGLAALLERSDIVVNLLPRTDATDGLLDAAAFATMPAGAALINFGRGQTVDDAALLDALDSGHLDHAVLDVFDVEPLPNEHRYWSHGAVTVLPHISGPTSTDTAAVIAADNVRRFLESGELPSDALVDRTRGY